MDIAQAKRRENIAEYILYLWQLEDLLRALQFSPEAIFSQLVEPRKDIPEEKKHLFLLWYMDIVNLLHQEGKDEKGHLEHTLHLISVVIIAQNEHQLRQRGFGGYVSARYDSHFQQLGRSLIMPHDNRAGLALGHV